MIFNCCWRENLKSLLIHCKKTLTLSALNTGTVDQRRNLFYRTLKHHSSILKRKCQTTMYSILTWHAIGCRFDMSLLRCFYYCTSVKLPVWKTVAATTV